MKKIIGIALIQCIIVLVFFLVGIAQAQLSIGIQVHPMTSGHPHIINNSVILHAPCNGCDHDITVNFQITEDMVTDGTDTYIGEWFLLTNTDPTCTAHFTVCSMVQYKEPNADANFIDPGSGLPDPWFVGEKPYDMTRHDADMDHPTCWYSCDAQWSPDAPYQTVRDYWNFHFGCVEMTLAPGASDWAFDGWHKVTDLITAHRYDDLPDGVDKTLTLSQDSWDGSGTDWKFYGQYTDFLDGCAVDNSSCNFANQPNIETGQSAEDCACCVNGWERYSSIIRKGGGGGILTSLIGFPTGNQVTMMTMKAYPARFNGVLTNAPAGTQLKIWASKDTFSNGMPKIDSGIIHADTLSGCTSDSLGFTFPFLISRMEDPGMRFQIILPNNSCSNIGNGRRIQLNAEVLSRTATSDYDSNKFMYWAHANFIRDTTPPVITNFVLHQIDSNRLAIFLQGSEDTTMIDKGYIKYRVNGGSQKLMMLRYESNDSVNHSTKFIDTLVTSVGHPQILLRGFIGNQVELLDSTVMDTCQLLYPQSVLRSQNQNLQLTDLNIDHINKILTASVKTGNDEVLIDLVTIDGKTIHLANQQSSGNEIRITKSFSTIAEGAYFLVIRSGGELLVKRIIL